jgi:hypothetical protein
MKNRKVNLADNIVLMLFLKYLGITLVLFLFHLAAFYYTNFVLRGVRINYIFPYEILIITPLILFLRQDVSLPPAKKTNFQTIVFGKIMKYLQEVLLAWIFIKMVIGIDYELIGGQSLCIGDNAKAMGFCNNFEFIFPEIIFTYMAFGLGELIKGYLTKCITKKCLIAGIVLIFTLLAAICSIKFLMVF